MRSLGMLLIIAVLAVGCGSTQTASTSIPNATLNGCLSQQQPTTPLKPGSLSLPGNHSGSDMIDHQQLAVGQMVEIRLGANIRWAVSTIPSSALLQAQTPVGWYSQPDGMCVWRYIATGVGVTRIGFTGGLVCAPGSACPAIAEIAQFEFTIL